MTDAQAFSARAPRRTNLSKPLPRSKSMTEEVVSTQASEPSSPTEITCEQFKASARRGYKLTKPAPRSKSVTECKEEQTSGVDQMVLNSIIRESDRLITSNQAVVSPNTAHRTAEQILLDALGDLPNRTETCIKHRLKSQVSVDSGVGDCNNNSGITGFMNVGRNNSINEVLPDEGFNDYPDDILTIEEELSSLAIDMKEQAPTLMVLRDPVSPYTFQACSIDGDAAAAGGGILTASGRRRMFELYRNSCNEKRVTKKELIQYTADELLEIGASPLSRQTPESWAYLVHTLPGLCLSKVTTYIDTLLYQQERGYVVECQNVRQSHDVSNRQQQYRFTNDERVVPSENKNNEPMQRWTVPANFNVSTERKGFGTPSNKKNFLQNQLVEEVTEADILLDTKCDVSVRPDRGAIKLFAAARQDLFKNHTFHDSPMKMPNYRLFGKNNDQSANLLTSVRQDMLKCYAVLESTRMKFPCNRDLNQKDSEGSTCYYEEDFYCNKDLPEKCPW